MYKFFLTKTSSGRKKITAGQKKYEKKNVTFGQNKKEMIHLTNNCTSNLLDYYKKLFTWPWQKKPYWTYLLCVALQKVLKNLVGYFFLKVLRQKKKMSVFFSSNRHTAAVTKWPRHLDVTPKKNRHKKKSLAHLLF